MGGTHFWKCRGRNRFGEKLKILDFALEGDWPWMALWFLLSFSPTNILLRKKKNVITWAKQKHKSSTQRKNTESNIRISVLSKTVIFLHSLYSLIRDEQAILADQEGVFQRLKEFYSISCTRIDSNHIVVNNNRLYGGRDTTFALKFQVVKIKQQF